MSEMSLRFVALQDEKMVESVTEIENTRGWYGYC